MKSNFDIHYYNCSDDGQCDDMVKSERYIYIYLYIFFLSHSTDFAF